MSWEIRISLALFAKSILSGLSEILKFVPSAIGKMMIINTISQMKMAAQIE